MLAWPFVRSGSSPLQLLKGHPSSSCEGHPRQTKHVRGWHGGLLLGGGVHCTTAGASGEDRSAGWGRGTSESHSSSGEGSSGCGELADAQLCSRSSLSRPVLWSIVSSWKPSWVPAAAAPPFVTSYHS